MADSVLGNVLVEPKLVYLNLEAKDSKEALTKLAGKLLDAGYVKDTFTDAVLAREVEFPTGLDFGSMGIAIPHTDSIHVNKQAIAIAVLKEPVEFVEMGTEDDKVKAECMFMMAIEKPESQITFLSKMMDMFQTEGRLEAIKAAKSEEEAADLFKKFLNE